MTVVIAIAAFALAIGVLVTVHEFGHFWVARRLGVKVLRFSIGFGKPLWRRVAADGTEYVIAALPLGGYVKMLDERETDTPVSAADLPRAFNRQSIPRRAAIVAAGPLFNFAFAIAAYWLVYMIGVPGIKPLLGEIAAETPAAAAGLMARDTITGVNGEATPTWEAVTLELLDGVLDGEPIRLAVQHADGVQETLLLTPPAETRALTEPGALLGGLGLALWRPELTAVIGALAEDGPATRSGLQVGDRILSVNNQPLADWSAWVEVVRAHPNAALDLQIERNGAAQPLLLITGSTTENGQTIGRIGAGPQVPEEYLASMRAELQYGPLAAIPVAFAKTWEISSLTVRLLGRMVIGDVSLKNISGPINIAQYAGFTASIGLVPFLIFLAAISVSLGILNLLPIPVLDGGHLAFLAVEAVKGAPVSEQTEVLGQKIGIALLLVLMSFAFYNDLARLFAN